MNCIGFIICMSYIRKHPRLSKHLKGNSVPLGKAVRLIKTVDLPFTRGGGLQQCKGLQSFLWLKRGKKGPKMALKCTKKSIKNPTGLLVVGGPKKSGPQNMVGEGQL